MGQTCQDDTRTEISRPGKPGLTTRMVANTLSGTHCFYVFNMFVSRTKCYHEKGNVLSVVHTEWEFTFLLQGSHRSRKSQAEK